MTPARLLLADDHSLILEGFRHVIEPKHEVVGMVTDGRALVEATLRLRPDLIILDITMPLLNGIDAAREIKKRLPEVKLLFVTMHANPTYLQAALDVGATGYVLKSSAREEILTAIEKVLKGEFFVTPGVCPKSLEEGADPARVAASLRLSPREREILQLVAEGRSTKEVAHVLHISQKTVAFHKDNVKRKLGLRTTAELTKYALQEGLV
jgi:DNA-binding NarL/FixJ family response regulator